MSKIKAVIFDAGGVLHESNTAMADDLRQELGITSSLLKQIRSNQLSLLSSGAIDEAEFWRQVTTKYGLREVTVAENLLGRAFAEALVEHAPISELVKKLGDSNVKLAVLSNTIQPHAIALKKAGIYSGFDHVLLSHEVGMLKPDPAIYQHALEELNVRPEATLFIDDDPKNVEAAEALGIHGVVYTETGKIVCEIRSLVFND